MLETRGFNRGSHICGRSVHNQRIERYWRDLMEGCTAVYYNLFFKLENERILDIDNPYHIWLLHYIFIPRLNATLEVFIEAWNHHPLSTEKNLTPMQIMLMNLPPEQHDLDLSTQVLGELDFSCEGLEDLGRFDDLNNPERSQAIDLREAELLEILRPLDILAESETHGFDIYQAALNLISMVP